LVTRGLEAATVQAIAERSGVYASAFYGRWSSRLDVVEEAVFRGCHVALGEAEFSVRAWPTLQPKKVSSRTR
jgi:AcrR family transcriptional regulator